MGTGLAPSKPTETPNPPPRLSSRAQLDRPNLHGFGGQNCLAHNSSARGRNLPKGPGPRSFGPEHNSVSPSPTTRNLAVPRLVPSPRAPRVQITRPGRVPCPVAHGPGQSAVTPVGKFRHTKFGVVPPDTNCRWSRDRHEASRIPTQSPADQHEFRTGAGPPDPLRPHATLPQGSLDIFAPLDAGSWPRVRGLPDLAGKRSAAIRGHSVGETAARIASTRLRRQ